jgi:alpha-L-rhamnosidase
MGKFFMKWQQDLAAGQMSNGRIADKVPGRVHYGWNGTDPVWVSEAVLGIWDIYRVYGDLHQLRRSYPMLQKLVDYYKSMADTNYIITQSMWGDYIGLDKPEPAFLSTAYFYQMVKTMSLMASALSRPDDAADYKMLAENIGRSIHRKFYHNGGYSNNSQGANAAALHFGLVPAALVPEVLERLEKAIAEKDYHVSTGGATTWNLMNALWLYDKTALAYKIAAQKTFPGWGFWVANGATTSWEQWQVDSGSSKNHGWLGSYLNTWLFRAIGGISALEPGYKVVKLIPGNVADLRFARSSLETIRGKIVFEWSKTSTGGLTMIVTIPANSRADVYVPLKDLISVGESNGFLYRKDQIMKPSKSVVSKGNKAEYAVFGIGSGTYKFTVIYK